MMPRAELSEQANRTCHTWSAIGLPLRHQCPMAQGAGGRDHWARRKPGQSTSNRSRNDLAASRIRQNPNELYLKRPPRQTAFLDRVARDEIAAARQKRRR